MKNIIFYLFLIIVTPFSFAQKPDPTSTAQTYTRYDISIARFGDVERQDWLRRTYRVKNQLNEAVIGQENATEAIQAKLIQYYEGFGSRVKDPISLHFIGLPGIGKSAILSELIRLGFPVVIIGMQDFAGDSGEWMFKHRLYQIEQQYRNRPLILVFDELDKIPEIIRDPQGNGDKTSPVIGRVNEIFTDGKLSDGSMDFSNAFVMSSMNLSPEEVEKFSKEAFSSPKSFYDFTDADFEQFDKWLSDNPQARYKVLSKIFRSNTVSRVAPNTLILESLFGEKYVKLISKIVKGTIKRVTTGDNASRRLYAEATESYLEFIKQRTAFGPSGAREAVANADALTEQAIIFGMKAKDPKGTLTDIPRKIILDFDERLQSVVVHITPQKFIKGKLTDLETFELPIAYNKGTRLFTPPSVIEVEVPPSFQNPSKKSTKISQADIKNQRYPEDAQHVKGLAKYLNTKIYGQEDSSKKIEEGMVSYFSRRGAAPKEPSGMILAGFPGIGKSDLVFLTAGYLDLPVIKINMQSYTSDTSEVVSSFISYIKKEIEKIGENQKFILLIEELDKVNEINPQTKGVINRPVMSAYKDILGEGVISGLIDTGYGESESVTLDFRNAFIFTTMNIHGDLFNFQADPRQTTIEDTLEAWQQLSSRQSDTKEMLARIFLPETISRMISKMNIVKPLLLEHYKKLINKKIVDKLVKNRFLNSEGRNISAIELKLTNNYLNYLYNETIIPSEGARNTLLSSSSLLERHVENALKAIKRSSPYAKQKITLKLDYKKVTSEVIASVVSPKVNNGKPTELYHTKVNLNFPRLPIDGQIEEQRLLVASHEFGHAFTAVRLGGRIEYMTPEPPSNGVGGYVKFKDVQSNSAAVLTSSLYSALGSRAMERILLSNNPLSGESSLDITSGSSGDIKSATHEIWRQLYELGMNPYGGVMERKGFGESTQFPYAYFSGLDDAKVEALGLVMRDLETALVADLLKAHSIEWYREKILYFARKGGMNEKEFYELIQYTYPGDNNYFLGERSKLYKEFSNQIRTFPEEADKAFNAKHSNTNTTAAENMTHMMNEYKKILKKRLNFNPDCNKIIERKK